MRNPINRRVRQISLLNLNGSVSQSQSLLVVFNPDPRRAMCTGVGLTVIIKSFILVK